LIVLGIDQKRESGGVRLPRSASSIRQERRTQATSLKSPVHGKPPDSNGGHGRITRQTLGFVRGKVNEGNTRRRDRVIGGHMAGDSFDGHEAIRNTAADVLGDLRLKIAIQRVFTAVK
jgi:hypothetical protein